MKTKTHWLRNTLLILAACVIAGLILGVFIFRGEGHKTYATASLQFSFNGAGEGTAPNGYPFTTDGLYEDEVIVEALRASALEGIYTVDQIRDHLEVIGVYPENLVNQMTRYTSLLDADADQQAALTDYHPTIFNVTLYNEFDPKITSGQLTGLLSNLLDAYRTYFSKTCSVSLEKSGTPGETDGYDVVQRLLALRTDTAQLSRYAGKMAELAPSFRLDGKGFDDLRIRYDALDTELQRLYASVTMNALSMDAERLRRQYEEELLSLREEQTARQEELRQVEKLADSYKKDSIVYVSTAQEMVKITGNTSETYDQLASKREAVTGRLLEIQERIETLEGLLADLKENGIGLKAGEALPEESDPSSINSGKANEKEILMEEIGRKITALGEKKDATTDDFAAMLSAYTAREINEQTVSITELKYKTPSLLSGAYIKTAIKTVGPLCALGFIVCVALLIRSRRKEEKMGMK